MANDLTDEKSMNGSIQPIKIQREIDLLWAIKFPHIGIKPCLLNVVVYTDSQKLEKSPIEIFIDTLIDHFPCRIIFIHSQEQNGDNGNFGLSLSIEESSLFKDIFSDRIAMKIAHSEIPQLAGFVLPLLATDLPIYLVWDAPLPRHPNFLSFKRFADELIFHSSEVKNLLLYIEHVTSWEKGNVNISDINWAKVGRWREILGHTFDSSERFAELKKAEQIEIIYNPADPSTLMQVLYLQAWLADCLDWQFQNREKELSGFRFYYEDSQGSHEISLKAQPSSCGEIKEIAISGKDSLSASFVCQDKEWIKITLETQYECTLPFLRRLPNAESGRSWLQEILFHKTGDRYFSMLSLLHQGLQSWNP